MKNKKPTVTAHCRFCNKDVPKKTFLHHVKLKCRYSPVISVGEKICSSCQKILPISEFYSCSSKADGRCTACKSCTLQRQSNWRINVLPSLTGERKVFRRPGKWVLKPCPYCGVEYSYNALVTHKPRCAKKPIFKRSGRPLIPGVTVPENTAEVKAIALSKDRIRECHLRFHYGITLDEYETMFAAQGGVCAICKQPWRGGKKMMELSVDHDHTTGKVRGLLCHMCNVGIGHFNEDVDLLETAIAYIEKTRATVAE